jgi:hypothetical protein
VVGLGGTVALSGVCALTSDFGGYCALLASGGVDCWGYGANGDLGNGTFYGSSPFGSALPVQVVGVGDTGALSGATSVASDRNGAYCALVASGNVDCWGYSPDGEIGGPNSSAYGSATPLAVPGVGAAGALGGVASVVSAGTSFCAALTSDGVDCWGDNADGELGNGTFASGTTPVQVIVP